LDNSLATIYVARSKTLSDWGYDVGLSKNIYKVGLTDLPVKDVVAAGWAGIADWVLVQKQDDVDDVTEDEIVARLAAKLKLVDPKLYPRIRDTPGIFRIVPTQVENSILVARTMAGEPDIPNFKVKPADIATFLIANALNLSLTL
jgi:hypothetical protein